MELHAPDPVACNRADELVAVLRRAEHDPVRGDRRERMHVVEGRRVGQPLDQRRLLPPSNRVPADLRDLQPRRIEGADLAGEQRKTTGATELDRALEQELHAQADAEHGHTLRTPLANQVVEPTLGDGAHRLRERANSRQDEPGRRADPLSVVGDLHVGAHVLERLLDRTQVAHSVVEDGDHSRPFVDGTPDAFGSKAAASRSARANDLKQASTMWCGSRPRSTVTCSVSFALLATARANSSTRSVSNPPMTRAGIARPSNATNGRPEMSIAADARASSIGTTACPKRVMPARSPRASSSAWPITMPTSSTVWCGPV